VLSGIASIVSMHKTDLVPHKKEINSLNVKRDTVQTSKNVICDIHVPHYW